MIALLIFIFFFFAIVLYLLIPVRLQNEDTLSSSPEQMEEFEDNNLEFENDDWDREVDEMPDDCLIYDDLFYEE